MLDVLTAPPRTRASTAGSVTFEVVLSADVDAPSRIVRVATATPFALVSMWLGVVEAGTRSVGMTLSLPDGVGFHTLTKRLERLVDVIAVTVLR